MGALNNIIAHMHQCIFTLVTCFYAYNLTEYIFRETLGARNDWKCPPWQDGLWLNQKNKKEAAIQRYGSTEFQENRYKGPGIEMYSVYHFPSRRAKINAKLIV